ncbi:MAG: hypothetical protein AAF934_03230 [Bacteroidota bacterium]
MGVPSTALRAGFQQSLLSPRRYRILKNPSLGEGGAANGSIGWAKELQQMLQSLTRYNLAIGQGN